MSPDEIFAAQMWTWPDPMLKRDASGRVIVVNASFLRLYGGQVGDWTGNPVDGWPAPQTPGQTTQFETRIEQDDKSETVYDWLEITLPDGSALALARDVTKFLSSSNTEMVQNVLSAASDQMPAQGPIVEQPTDSYAAQHQPVEAAAAPANFGADQVAMAQHSPAEFVPPAAVNPSEYPNQTYQAAPVLQPSIPEIAPPPMPAPPPMAYEPAPAVPQAQVPVPQAQVVVPPTPELPKQENFAPSQAAAGFPAQAHHVSSNNVPVTPPQQVPEVQQPIVAPPPAVQVRPPQSVTPPPMNAAPALAEPPREVVRRTLPIEDGDAVLGNNWRDAVIAKAVGVEDLSEAKSNQSETEDTGPESSVAGRKILLAEDNAINALLTRTLLEAEGCTVDVVEDGVLAVDAVRNTNYDMVFMDMRMPNMDGLEATRKIRAMGHNAKDLPIVALTANAFDDDRNACFDSGMNDFMTKPVAAEELSEMVQRHTAVSAQAA